MRLGYNTNGLAHHDPLEALALLAEIGYESVALTVDHGLLDPFAADSQRQRDEIAHALQRHKLRSVIETGTRYLLDFRHKHEPTLMSADPADRVRRVTFLKYAVEVAAELKSDCVSCWSGILRDECSAEIAWQRLLPGLREVVVYAAERNVQIGFEPEPGMFIDTMSRFEELLQRLGDERLKLTLDVGHLHCLSETPLAAQIHRWAKSIINVHIEDMRSAVHEHLMFGEGEIEFAPVIQAFREINYQGSLHVELSRHSHEGPLAAQRAFDFLKRAVGVDATMF